jgi:hypothetical protein
MRVALVSTEGLLLHEQHQRGEYRRGFVAQVPRNSAAPSVCGLKLLVYAALSYIGSSRRYRGTLQLLRTLLISSRTLPHKS